MNNKTNSKNLFEEAKQIIPGGVHSPVRSFKGVEGDPIFFKSAKGAFLTSIEDDIYTDFCQSFGPLILGHRNDDIEKVLINAIQHTAWSLGTCEPYSLELCKWITSRIPWAEKIRLVSSGTEAVMSAIRLARAYTKKDLILKFEGCYHGHTDSMLVKAGSGLATLATSNSLGVPESISSTTLVAPLDQEEIIEKIFDQHKNKIAAIIIEPLPANNGLLIQRTEFLQFLAQIAKKNNSLLIFDEVISGFRTHIQGMAGLLNIEPDLVTYGKILGGGFPVGAYAGKKNIMDLIAPEGGVYQAGTLSANPIAVQAGLTTLQKIESEKTIDKLNKKTQLFTNKINEAFSKENIPLQATNFSSIFWIHPKTTFSIRNIDQIPSHTKSIFNQLFHNLLNKRIYFPPSPFEVCFISSAHDESLLEKSYTDILKAAKEINFNQK